MENNFAELYTAEGENLPETPWNVYPRPQMRRDSFLCLNGEWKLFIGGEEHKITVPFPPESLLSGLHTRIPKRAEIVYKKKFYLPDGFIKGRVLLHFGAVDQIARVKFNGKCIGKHVGGYAPFCFDITELLRRKNTLEVFVRDELHTGILPYGKQCEKRGGMWYTPVTGIWQTVWVESVPEEYVRSLRIETGADFAEIFAENTYSQVFRMANGKVLEAVNGNTYGAGIRILKGLEEVYGYTNDISPKGLKKLAISLSSSYNDEPLNIQYELTNQNHPLPCGFFEF